jgi:tetratricopeptide (TPR) repeat protein
MPTRQKEYLGFMVIIIILNFITSISIGKAMITEEQKSIKTYPFSDSDPVPVLTRGGIWGSESRIYPYFSFEKYSLTPTNKTWTIVQMENPYIKVSIMPEIGGKVWGAIEKSTQREFIYSNDVVKFRNIALRGPWTSGGIEFNFGIIGHTPTGATPVDYILQKNSDGSVSCIVGATDLPSRTRWSVRVTVPKDKAYFETQTFWYNPSVWDQSYYCWMNSAAAAGDDLQYILPGHSQIGHDYSVPMGPWPVDKNGRNLSWYKNNNFGSDKSYFTVGEYENFCGGYWHDSKFGYGHWALYDDMPGRKTFLWSLAREGGIWEHLLTDNSGQYTEPQAGRLFDQNDHEFFNPYTADSWRQIWFPYKEIGPMVQATPYCVLNTKRTDNSIIIGICPLQILDDEMVITIGGHDIFRTRLKLQPMEIYQKILPARTEEGAMVVTIPNKLYYTDDPKANELSRPIHFHNFDENTTEGLYLSAERDEKSRNYPKALTKYLACIEREPLHTRALCRIAELYGRRAEYEKALQYAGKVLENLMYDPDANYIYGTLCRHLGNTVDAKETLGWAARSMKYRSTAYCQMAEIYLYEKNHDLSMEYARRALDYNQYNINALQVMAVTYRKLNLSQKAREVLDKIIEIEPLNHMARFEAFLLNSNQKNLKQFQSLIRNELPHETYLELAVYYHQLGLYNESIQLLKYAPEYPTVDYWLAYLLRDESPDESRMYLEKAYGLSPQLVFPFREESIPVFRWAQNKNPDNWKTKYYLGLLYWSKGRKEEATDLFADCRQIPDFAPFYVARGNLYKETNIEKTRADFEHALAVESENSKYWHNLARFFYEQSMNERSLALCQQATERFPDDTAIKVDLAFALADANCWQQSLAILEKVEFLPAEGGGIHKLFVRCQLHLALENMEKGDYAKAIQCIEKSKEYPENLGRGRPFEPNFKVQEYLIAICEEKMKATDEHEQRFQTTPEVLRMLEKDGIQ